MKFSTAVVVAGSAAVFSAGTWAADLPDIPQCALTCFAQSIQGTTCSTTDIACACSNSKFISNSATCVLSACSAADQEKAHTGAIALCKANGVAVPTTLTGTPYPATTATPSISYGGATTRTPPGLTTVSPNASVSARPTYGSAGNRTNTSTTVPSGRPTSISNGAERLTTAFSVIGLSIAAACFAL